MKNCVLLLIFVSLILTSCSTLIHQKAIRVNIYSDIDSAQVCLNDSSECYVTPVTIDLMRSKQDVDLIIKKDSLFKEFTLESKLSPAFWVGNIFSGIGIFGYAIDLTNPKRFKYPKYNYIQLKDNPEKIKTVKWIPPVKNQLNFKISVPEGNFFYFQKQYAYGSSFGFLGISGGLEYYYSNRNSINIDFGTMTDFFMPVPAHVDYEGVYDRTYASYIDLQLGSDFKTFHTDFGVQANTIFYYIIDSYADNTDTLNYANEQFNIGLAFSGYYKISNGFNLGLNYYPSVFTWNNGDFDFHYAHLIMFELVFKIQAFRPEILRAGNRMKINRIQ